METERQTRCSACGQTWLLQRVDLLNDTPNAHLYSPCCGASMLPARSAFDALDASCFRRTGAPRHLLALLYQEWRAGGKWQPRNYRRFVDYVEHVLYSVRKLTSNGN